MSMHTMRRNRCEHLGCGRPYLVPGGKHLKIIIPCDGREIPLTMLLSPSDHRVIKNDIASLLRRVRDVRA